MKPGKGRRLSTQRTFPRLKVLSAAGEAITRYFDALLIGFRELFRFDNTFVHKLCLIIGLASITGFLVDISITALPLQPFAPAWQIDVIRAAADRSLVWLIGLGLLAFTLRDNAFLKRPFSLLCLLLGVIYLLLSIPLFQGALSLRDNATANLGQQQSQALEQLQALQANPPEGVEEITPEQIEAATQQINRQVEIQRRNAQQRLYKTLAMAIGNLLVAGIAAIALSRLVAGEIDFDGIANNAPGRKPFANSGDREDKWPVS